MPKPDQNQAATPVPDFAPALARLQRAHPEQVQTAVSLRDLTTLGIGGPAAAVCNIHTPSDAQMFQAFGVEQALPVYFLGAGSNILADDAGFRGLILRIVLDDYAVAGEVVTVGAGFAFDELIRCSLRDGLVGLEFASGIPGTVGGALVGNAGCFGHEIGEFLVAATVLNPDGRLSRIGPEDFAFGYRNSALKESGRVVLGCELRLGRGDVAAAAAVRAEKLQLRRDRHPVDIPCAGSYFQNLPPATAGGRRRAAGELLDRAGAGQLRVGGAGVFDRHANIIVNLGGASCNDVLELARQMRDLVRRRFAVELVEEVRYLKTAAGHRPGGSGAT